MTENEDSGRVHIDPQQRYASGGSPLTPAEDEAGAKALKAYVDKMLEANGLSWEETFIPDSIYVQGATDAIEAADAGDDQSLQGRVSSAAAALRVAIDSTGQGGQISDDNLTEAASEILTAVAKVRAQENPPVRPLPPVPEPEPVVDGPRDDTGDDGPGATAGQTGQVSGQPQTGVAGPADGQD